KNKHLHLKNIVWQKIDFYLLKQALSFFETGEIENDTPLVLEIPNWKEMQYGKVYKIGTGKITSVRIFENRKVTLCFHSKENIPEFHNFFELHLLTND
ncbi:MAG: hypothetical protein GY940_36660, partial [bacterium]|nr:hypothetical protein [bacterium]